MAVLLEPDHHNVSHITSAQTLELLMPVVLKWAKQNITDTHTCTHTYGGLPRHNPNATSGLHTGAQLAIVLWAPESWYQPAASACESSLSCVRLQHKTVKECK